MQHIDAVHLIPWKLMTQRTQTCRKCGLGIDLGKLDQHMKSKHAEDDYISEPENINIDIESNENENNMTSDIGQVEERNCPTPIPESLFICGECHIGIESENEVESHMRIHHTEVMRDERIEYLEAELRAEKEQHMYRTEALEDALKKVKDLEQRKEYLEAINSNQEAQIVNFKIELEEKDKIIIKSKSKYIEEINELKRQQMQTTENLRSTVLKREVIKRK